MEPASSWLGARLARPLAWWSAERIARFEGALAGVLATWGQAWGLPDTAWQVHAQPIASPWQAPAGVATFQAGGTAMAWLQWDDPDAERIRTLLFDAPAQDGPISRAVAAACKGDAAARIAALLDLATATVRAGPSAGDVRAGSGALDVRVDGTVQGRLVVGAQAAHRWREGSTPRAPGRPALPLSSVPEALARHSVSLEVRLQGCELDVGTLQDLRPGDVVRLQHLLKSPAVLADGDDRPLFHGYLGRQGADKAIGLTRTRS